MDSTGNMASKKLDNEKDLAQIIADSHDNILSPKKIIIVLVAMASALFLTFVDQTGITVALPYIAQDLNAEETISWAGTASLISNTVFMVLAGRLSDIFSRKYTMVFCMVLLAFSDLACGLAKTSTQFYIFRAFCGVGNAGITSLTMVIVSDIVTLEQRGRYQGILGSCVGFGNAIGPFIAAAFIEHSSWRKFYYTLFPIILSATLVIIKIVPYTKPENSMKEKLKSVDYLGLLSSSIFIIFVLIPVSGGGSTFAWRSDFVISMIIIGGVFFIAFIIIEAKIANLPLIPIKLFNTSWSLTLLFSQNFFFGVCYYSALYYYPYYFEVIRGFTVIRTSCFTLGLVIPQSIFSICSGQIISRTKKFWFVVWFGYIIWMIAVCLLNLWTTTNNIGVNVITLILNGMGVGCIFQPTMVALQAHSYKKDRATVISTRNVLRSFGGAIGLAVSSTILANTFKKKLNLSGPEYFTLSEIEELKKMVYTKIDLTKYTSEQVEYLKGLYMVSLRSIFYVWIGCIGYCVISNIPIRDYGLKPKDDVDR